MRNYSGFLHQALVALNDKLPKLLGRVRQSSVNLAAAEEAALALVQKYCPQPPPEKRKEGCPLAGRVHGIRLAAKGREPCGQRGLDLRCAQAAHADLRSPPALTSN